MGDPGAWRLHPELRDLIAEATRSLARLDAGRLEELALSCRALIRDLEAAGRPWQQEMVRQAWEAQGDLAVFGRVLEATAANLAVMNRIRELRAGGALEYGGHRPHAAGGNGDH